MYKLLLFCYTPTLFFANAGHAQQTSRIVFFREGPFYHDISITRLKLYRNGQKIHKIRQHEIFVYDSPDIDGAYSIQPRRKHVSNIHGTPGSITFVEVRLKGGLLIANTRIRQFSLDQFKDYYTHEKWIRKRLKNAGYGSIDELTKDYDVVVK